MGDLTPETVAELRRLRESALSGDWYYGPPDGPHPTQAAAWQASCLNDPDAPATALQMVWSPDPDDDHHTRVVAITGDGPRSGDHARLIWAMWYYFPALLDAAAERDALAAKLDAAIDVAHLDRQRAWSAETFGPAGVRGHRGILDHIRKELVEIEAEPGDVTEWADLILLAFDGAWRSGHPPADTVAAIKAKQARNEARTWPDWRTADPDKAIEHVRALDAPPPGTGGGS